MNDKEIINKISEFKMWLHNQNDSAVWTWENSDVSYGYCSAYEEVLDKFKELGLD